jgi:hypothetical protein
LTIRRATVNDADFIKTVYKTPDIWESITDDSTVSADLGDMPALTVPTMYFLIPDNIGVFFFHPWNGTTYEVHSAILPGYRGKLAYEAALATRQWIWDNTSVQKIVTLIPTKNYRARALARCVGMVQEGIVTKSYMKNGKAEDQYLFGISREGI